MTNTIGLGEYTNEDLVAELKNRSGINRLEIIDHSDCMYCEGTGKTPTDSAAGLTASFRCIHCDGVGFLGRRVVMWDDGKSVDISLQDDGRTLKLFIEGKDGGKISL